MKTAFAPVDSVPDYERYVDGVPPANDVSNVLAALDRELPEGTDHDPRTLA